jgi:glycosyltransferase involved in cell wall biosynthesis
VFRTLIPAARWTVDAILTDSESARRDLIRHVGFAPPKVYVTCPGVDLPYPADLNRWTTQVGVVAHRYGISSPYFLYVGALNPRKNIRRLVAAFAEVHAQYSETQLVVVGPKSPWADETEAQSSQLGDAVRLTGFVDDSSLHALYVGARAVVYPSLYEGFGLPALEAMAHGAPIITSNTSSLPEVVGDAGLLVDPTDVQAIAAAMRQVLTDSKLAQTLSFLGRQRAQQFTWEHTARATLQVYRHVVNGQGSS